METCSNQEKSIGHEVFVSQFFFRRAHHHNCVPSYVYFYESDKMNRCDSNTSKKSKKKIKTKNSKLQANQEKHLIREDIENRNSKINILRSVIAAEPKLNCPTDEAFLLVFLRTKDFNVERAFKLLLNYWSMRYTSADLFGDLSLSSLQHVFDEQYQDMSHSRDQHGHRIYYFRAGRWNPAVCSLQELLRANLCFLHRIASEPETQRNGIIAIADMKGLNLNQVRHFTPSYAQKICSIIQDSFPLRYKGIHIINEPFVFSIILSLLWPFLKEKIRTRIKCHGTSLSSLHQHVDKAFLTESYGGLLPDVDNSAWVKKLAKETHHFDFFHK